VNNRPWSSAAPPGEFRSYISTEETLAEFTVRAVILGALFGLLFGAVTVYVGLRAGLTVSASIPISVLSISILRAFGRSTILENNIVQTTGSAGESLAAGVMFTLPALIFLGFGKEFTFWRIFPLALLGGWLGVLFMVPIRRQLIVKEHGNLTFPEGSACADVLVAGERGGSFAGRVFWGLGLGGLYTFLMNTVQAWTSQPESRPSWFPGASFRGLSLVMNVKSASSAAIRPIFARLPVSRQPPQPNARSRRPRVITRSVWSTLRSASSVCA
jgi:putative OPT family oligopeptide transporter